MFEIHHFFSAAGELSSVCLRVRSGVLEIVAEDGARALPPGALHAVLARFGAPFDAAARITEVAILELGAGEVLRHVRHLAGYDVIARDYIVYERPELDALCALATTVSAVLLHLSRAAASNR
jgi:hypothetical protein